MNAEDDVTDALNGSLLIMIEMPINTFELVCALVLLRQRVIQSEVNGQGRQLGVLAEKLDDGRQQWLANVIGAPRTDTEEIGQITGIDTVEFEFGQPSQSFASRGNGHEVGEAFQVTQLRLAQCRSQSHQSQERANGQ